MLKTRDGPLLFFSCADGAGCLNTIHLWHPDVDQDQLKRLLFQGIEDSLLGIDDAEAVATFLKNPCCELLVDLMILGEQDVERALLVSARGQVLALGLNCSPLTTRLRRLRD